MIHRRSPAPIAALAALALGGDARAQSPRQLWLVYSGDHALGGRAALLLDAQSRRTVDGPYYRQLLVRPAVAWTLSPYLRLIGGWTFARTTTDEDDADDPRPHQLEHRAWQMVQLTHPASALVLRHRVRLEERWIHAHHAAWLPAQRVRYQLQGSLPLARVTPAASRVALSASEELFGGFGGTAGTLSFDQSRTAAGLTVRMTPTMNVGAGYLLQAIAHPREGFSERRHVMQLTLSSSAPFARR